MSHSARGIDFILYSNSSPAMGVMLNTHQPGSKFKRNGSAEIFAHKKVFAIVSTPVWARDTLEANCFEEVSSEELKLLLRCGATARGRNLRQVDHEPLHDRGPVSRSIPIPKFSCSRSHVCCYDWRSSSSASSVNS